MQFLCFRSIKSVNTFQPEETEEHILEAEEIKESVKQNAKAHLTQQYKDEISSKTLAAYIEVCSNMRNPQRGLNAFNFHRGRVKRFQDKSFISITNVYVFNALLKGFASKGLWNKMREVLKIMEEDKVELNLQSFVSVFECLGRVNVMNNHLKDIRIFTKSALAKGITFDKMMNYGIFLNNERDIVLEAIRSYDPNYVPMYKKPDVCYKNHLLDHLNCDKQLEPESLKYKENGGLFKPKDLEEMIDKQIAMEKDGYVTVCTFFCYLGNNFYKTLEFP